MMNSFLDYVLNFFKEREENKPWYNLYETGVTPSLNYPSGSMYDSFIECADKYPNVYAYKYCPKTTGELKQIIEEHIKKEELYTKEDVDFAIGDVLMHLIYGRGVVVEVKGDFITVAFAKNFGIKKLMKNHKSITKI